MGGRTTRKIAVGLSVCAAAGAGIAAPAIAAKGDATAKGDHSVASVVEGDAVSPSRPWRSPRPT